MFPKSPLNDVAKAVLRAFKGNLASVAVFGSFAAGDYGRNSDIDLLVLTKEPISSRGRINVKFTQQFANLIQQFSIAGTWPSRRSSRP